MINLRQLRYFVGIAEVGNITKAAEQLNVAQPTLGLQIRQLEQALQTELLLRHSRGVVLTKRGADLIENARRIVTMLDETAAAMRAPPLDGPVRIGIPEEYGHAILSRALSAFSRRHAQVEVTVRYAHSPAQMQALAEGELDLAVVFEWQDFGGGEVLMQDPTVWVTSMLHPVHEERPVPIALYSRDGWCRDFAMRSLEQRGLNHRIAYMSDTTGGLKLAVTSGLAIAPISRSNIPAGCRELTAADGFGDIDSSNVVLRRNPLAVGEAIDGMAEAIREAFTSR